jgi:serine/threonine-protein kinase HipA
VTVVEVWLWGTLIGAAADDERGVVTFEYSPGFVRSGIEVSPITMALRTQPYEFGELSRETFRGLPGLLADSLPDRFGNALIDAWLQRQGRSPSSFSALERLCYIADRGMGALQFRPALGPGNDGDGEALHVAQLVRLASEVLQHRSALTGNLGDGQDDALASILRVGTSAGGARAKAVIAWNELTNEVRSGQTHLDPPFSHWLLKFDGVAQNRDKEAADETGFGTIEYAYSLMAADAAVTMSRCRLLHDGQHRHFMTRRFDRPDGGGSLHMQSLGALTHSDFNLAGAYSYEEAVNVLRLIGAPPSDREQLVRRALFNIVARNQDDHVKNISFLMDRSGRWRLSPAYDVTYSYNPDGAWTSSHQMTINGKRDGFTVDDIDAFGRAAQLPRGRATRIAAQVVAAASRWPTHAASAGVSKRWTAQIGENLRTSLL